MALSEATIELVQTKLKTLGFYNGDIDGDAGPATYRAVAQGLAQRQSEIPPRQHVLPGQNTTTTTNWTDWSDESKLIAFFQLMAKDQGLNIGPIDGIGGDLTTKASLAMTSKAPDNGPKPAPVPVPAPVTAPASISAPNLGKAAAFAFSFTNDDFFAVIGPVMDRNEGAKMINGAFVLENANTAGSSYSIGRTQTDLGARPQSYSELMALITAKDGASVANALAAGLKTKGNPHALSPDQKVVVNAVLASTDGKAMVGNWDNNNFLGMLDVSRKTGQNAANNPFFSLSTAFKASACGLKTALYVADHANQYGPKTIIDSWAAGNDVVIDGRHVTRPSDQLSFEDLMRLGHAFAYANSHPKDPVRRCTNILDVLVLFHKITPEEHMTDLASIHKVYGI